MAGAGLVFDQFSLTDNELKSVSKFIIAINNLRAKNDKPSIQREEACKFMLATNFDVTASLELVRNYEKYYADYDIASVSDDTKQIETAWYNRKIWHTERRDKDGAAIIFFERGLTDSGKDHKAIVQTLFLSLQDAAKSTRTQRNGIIILMDLHDASITNIDHTLMKLIFRILLEVYPLFVKSLFLIDVPLWLKVKQKVEHFLTPQVRHKIKIVSRVELTKALPAQSVPTTLGGSGDASGLQNLSWLNVMSSDKHSPAEAKPSALQPGKSVDDIGLGKRPPILPRAFQNTKKGSDNKAHPFATTAAKTESSSAGNTPVRMPTVSDKRQPVSKPSIPPPFSGVKNGNVSSASNKGIASIISNWEGRASVKQSSSDKSFNSSSKMGKQPSDKSQDDAVMNGSVSKMAANFTQLTPSGSLKIRWGNQDSLCSNDGDYIKNWIPTHPPSDYENVAMDTPSGYENVVIDKPNFTTADHKPFSLAVGVGQSQTKQPKTYDSNNAYEIVNYQPTTAHPVKPTLSNRKPLPASSPAKLAHDYVNVEIPSDPEPLPPPVPSKKKRPPAKAAVVNDQSDDSELDEEEGNELRYENWSFMNPREGDQNMTISELDAYVKSRKQQGLKAEYFKIRNKPEESEMNICKLPCNSKKNRYRDVGCLDRNRVKLNRVHGKEGSDYIHANYADGYKTPKEFILTQGPLKGTVVDFWRMIWEQKALVIVMLTRCMELNRWKCSQYWPDSGSTVYGDIHVELLHSEEVQSFTLRTLRVHHVGDEAIKHDINHFQFTTWPDYGVPSSGMDILQLIRAVKDSQVALFAKCPPTMGHFPPHGPPIVVHCSAGVGRTGTFCTIDYCIQQWLDTKKVNIQACVKSLRAQRAYSIQTEDQYYFCYKCVLEFAKNWA